MRKILVQKISNCNQKTKKKNPVPNINIFTPLYIIILSVYIILLQCIVYKMEEMMKNYYGSLCTEMYEILHKDAPEDELDFYLSYTCLLYTSDAADEL